MPILRTEVTAICTGRRVDAAQGHKKRVMARERPVWFGISWLPLDICAAIVRSWDRGLPNRPSRETMNDDD